MNTSLSNINIAIHRTLILCAVLAFLVSCSQQATAPGTATTQEPIKRPGYYEDPTLGFSISWSTKIFTVQRPTNEAMVVNVAHKASSPVLNVLVDKDGSKYTLDNAAQLYLDATKAMFPNTTRHKIYSQKKIKIDGYDSLYGEMTWTWEGGFPLVTTFTTTLKDGKAITVSATAMPGKPSVDVLEAWAKSIHFK